MRRQICILFIILAVISINANGQTQGQGPGVVYPVYPMHTTMFDSVCYTSYPVDHQMLLTRNGKSQGLYCDEGTYDENYQYLQNVSRVYLYVEMSLAGDYTYGDRGNTAENYNIEAVLGINYYVGLSSGTPLTSETQTLTLNNTDGIHGDKRSVYKRDITNLYRTNNIHSILININSLTNLGSTSAFFTDLKNRLRIRSYYVVEKRPIPNPSNYIERISYVAEPNPEYSSLTNKSTFKWVMDCGEAKGYQIQVLRLYNNDASMTTETSIKTKIDWDKALTLEKMSPNPNLSLTLTEGTGYYAWRVRPIYEIYLAADGAESDYRNYGDWTYPDLPYPNPMTGLTGVSGSSPGGSPGVSTSGHSGVFFYTQFDADKNWIHSQVFAEGSEETGNSLQVKEGMVYADGLNNSKQQQSIVNGEGVVVSQSFIDYSGRPAVSTLPIPLDKGLGYVPNLFRNSNNANYDAPDFDLLNNCLNPSTMQVNGSLYYTNTYPDERIASAGGYLFTRNVFETDGSNSVKERTLPGEAHKLVPLANQATTPPHTYRNGDGDVTPKEIEVLFGTETPEPTSTYKKYEIDPNGTVSISYVNSAGKTIATCLQRGDGVLLEQLQKKDGTPLLQEIGEESLDTTITKDVSATWENLPGNNGISSSYKIYVPFPSLNLRLDYVFNDEEFIQYICESRCTQCDYEVEIRIKYLDADPGTNDIVYTWNHSFIPQDVCHGYAPVSFANQQVALTMPGNYVVERIIRTRNNVAGQNYTYYDHKVLEIEQQLTAQYQQELNAHYQYLDGTKGGLDAFYASFGESVTIDGIENKMFIFNECDTIYIPVKRCQVTTCEDADLDSWPGKFWEHNDPDHLGDPLPAPSTGISFTQTDFSKLLNAMVDEGYDCEKLWNCWYGCIVGYQNNMALQDASSGQTPGWAGSVPGLPVYEYNLVEDFLSCTGKICHTVTPHSAVFTNDADDYRANAYKRVFYADNDRLLACQTAVGTNLSQDDEQYYSAIESCINGNLDPSVDLSDYQTGLTQTTDEMQHSVCVTACEAKRSVIETAIKDYYQGLGYYIEGESYLCSVHHIHWIYHQGGTNDHLHGTFTGTISQSDFQCFIDGVIQNCEGKLCNWGDPTRIDRLINAQPVITGIKCNSFSYNESSEYLLNFINSEYDRLLEQLSTSGLQCIDWNLMGTVTAAGSSFVNCKDYDEYIIPVCSDPNIHYRFSLSQSGSYYYLHIHTYTTTYEDGHPQIDSTDKIIKCEIDLKGKSCDYPCVDWKIPEKPDEDATVITCFDCNSELSNTIRSNLAIELSKIVAKHKDEYVSQYRTKCLDHLHLKDHLLVSYDVDYYHYTLYYYDRAGNLVRTVPPKGIRMVYNRTETTTHVLDTRYEYNSIKQLLAQETPDGGLTKFFYDDKGNLRFSQNAKQAPNNQYSYTKFDSHYRTIESGQFVSATGVSDMVNDVDYPYGNNLTKRYLLKFAYSEAYPSVSYFNQQYQQFLEDRIGYAISDEDGLLSTLGDQIKTYYSYDPHGNVNWMIQDVPQIGKNYLKYSYDLISGSVLKVSYNENLIDKMFHRYVYDADKRIRRVETSRDNGIWETDAVYDYYRHGPLARVQLGDDRVQAMDYVYTVHGWLKGINTRGLVKGDSLYDGGAGSAIPKDVVAFGYKYYNNDFGRGLAEATGGDLYNGNIGQWMSILNLPESIPAGVADEFVNKPITKFKYRYDELNRLLSSTHSYDVSIALQPYSWNRYSYYENFTYDPNGNIKTLERHGVHNGAPALIDKLTYSYTPLTRNRLTALAEDPSTVNDAALGDIPQAIGSNNPNYTYDAIGNLIEDKSEKLRMEWTPYGKLSKVTKFIDANFSVFDVILKYYYDASGNRVCVERQKNPVALGQCGYGYPESFEVGTYYIRDAQGNVMSVYDRHYKTVGGQCRAVFSQTEVPIYGSDRIGMYRKEIEVASVNAGVDPNTIETFDRGSVNFGYAIGAGAESVVENSVSTMSYMGSGQFITATQNNRSIPGTDSLGYLAMSGAAESISGARAGETSQLIDHEGRPVATFETMESFNGTGNVGLLLDETNTIYQNSDSIITAPTAASVMVRIPQGDRQAYLFTVGTDRKLYRHLINYQTKKVEEKNVPVDTGYAYTGAITAIEDYTLTQGDTNVRVYAVRQPKNTDTVQLVMYSLTPKEICTPAVLNGFRASANQRCRSLAVSPGRKFIAMGQHKGTPRSFTGMYDSAYVRVYNLDSTYRSVSFRERIAVADTLVRIESITFNTIDSIYFVYSLNNKTKLMAFKQGNGVNNKTVVKSNILRHTDGRLYVGTADGIRSINADGSNGPLLPNTGSVSPMFVTVPIIILPGFHIATQGFFAQYSGRKVYELKDHLGNVRAVITDRKFLTGGTAPKYQAELVTATDYYAYGSPMKGRIYTTQTGSYRFGFNTQEKVDEVSGDGNHNTAEFWEYDTRLGRRWNLDPKSQVNISDYAVMGCNPVFNMDWLGDKWGNPKEDSKHGREVKKEAAYRLKKLKPKEEKLREKRDALEEKKNKAEENMINNQNEETEAAYNKANSDYTSAYDDWEETDLMIKDLETIGETIDKMGDKENPDIYTFRSTDSKEGFLSWEKDKDNNVVTVINYSKNLGSNFFTRANKAHEIFHVSQYMAGLMLPNWEDGINSTNTANLIHCPNAERDAYRAQYSYNPDSLPSEAFDEDKFKKGTKRYFTIKDPGFSK